MTEPPICDLDTEARALELSDLGSRTAVEVVRAVVGGHDAVLASVLAAAEDIAALAEAAAEQLAGGGRVIYAGAGAAGRAAVADASEWTPTFNVAPDSVIALLAGVDAVAGSVEEAAAEDDAAAGAAAVRALAVSAGDLCIGVSASGRTPYTVGAVRAAGEVGALTGAVVCASGSALAELASLVVEVPVGPEVLAGSTRLKAATAQKLVLNAFSTAVMARRGRMLGNLMACLRVSNEKLRVRAAGICQVVCGCSAAAATEALDQAGGVLEVALVMLARRVDADAARAALAATGGHLPEALGGPAPPSARS